MSWLRIVHRTHYTYHRPVTFGEHRLVLRPREGHDLRVESQRLSIQPEARLHWSRDVFGNSVATATFAEPAAELNIVNDVLVWRSPDAAGPDQAASAEPWPVVYQPLETVVAESYRQSVYPEERDAVKSWLATIALPEPRTADGVLRRVNEVLHQTFDYRRREEKGVWSPARVLAERAGSCRDLATLFLEAARLLGFAARFASGYLEGSAALAGRASTHAWMEAYFPGRGWRGYDPTLGRLTGLQHVVTGVSNHPRGVMPVSGRFGGSAGDLRALTVSVAMERPARKPVSTVAENAAPPSPLPSVRTVDA